MNLEPPQMQDFPDLSDSPYHDPVLKTRPNLSLEDEARVCGIAEADLAAAWRDLELAESRPASIAATHRYFELASVALIDAVLGVLQPPAKYAKTARYDFSMAFTYRGHKRFWRADLGRLLTY